MRDGDVEAIAAAVEAAQAERQRLRELGAPTPRLERNRLRLVALQHQLAHALIARYATSTRAA